MKMKLPKRPKGPMTGTAQFGRGWTRAHNFDQPKLPYRRAK